MPRKSDRMFLVTPYPGSPYMSYVYRSPFGVLKASILFGKSLTDHMNALCGRPSEGPNMCAISSFGVETDYA